MIPPVLPTLEELQPWLAKLERHEGSIVLICLESFATRTDCRCAVGWFDEAEKKALRVALLKARRSVKPRPRRRL